MVTFLCGACGDSVRKNQVEKHYTQQCRNCNVLSCIDCGKDFPGDSYIAHTSCITEAEKYQGNLYKEKENKGVTKQKAWTDKLQDAISSGNCEPRIRGLMEKIAEYSNVPRKQKKFENFCKNSVRVYDQPTLDKLWKAFQEANKPAVVPVPANNAGAPEQNGDAPAETDDSVEADVSMDGSPTTDANDDDAPKSDDSTTKSNGSTAEHEQHVQRKKKKKKTKNQVDNGNANGNTEVTAMEVDNSEAKKHAGKNKDQGKTMSKKKRKRAEMEQQSAAAASAESAEPAAPANKKLKGKRKGGGKENVVAMATDTDADGGEVQKGADQKNVSSGSTAASADTPELPLAESGKFQWHRAIKLVLKESEDHELPMKKLRKKVLSAYAAHGVDHRASNVAESNCMFDKKLSTYPKVKIAKNLVKLIK